MYIYRCEDSLESIFSAIYNVYENKHNKAEVSLVLDAQPRLFSTEILVETDSEKYEKVIRTIRRQFGDNDYRSVCLALASFDEEKAQAVYGTVSQGLERNCGQGHLFDNLADEYVNKAFKLARNADRENCHLRGFSRFEELENGLLFSKIEPKNNLLAFLMPHFSDRFPAENFIIHDKGRNLYGIHHAESVENGKIGWYLLQGEYWMSEDLKLSSEEIKYQMLFRGFCQEIAIDSRKNPKLQQNMLPLHFREFMTEFQ